MYKEKRVLLILFIVFGSITIRAQVMDSPPNDGVYDKINVKNRKPIPYAPLREADVFWSKRVWRILNMKEKINQPFYYPTQPENGRRSFMQVVMDALKEGTITPYSSESEEFLIPTTYTEIMKSLSKNDSTEATDTAPPYNTHWKKIKHEFDPSEVTKLRLKEDWFFDKQRSVMDVRIIGVCPIIEEFDADGVTSKGYHALFWLYFPEARTVFANSEVFNRFNDAERRSYDDIFYKRMFGSYIYKESSVYDRRIAEYAKGMDALLESEKIKNDIFLAEHDLWEY